MTRLYILVLCLALTGQAQASTSTYSRVASTLATVDTLLIEGATDSDCKAIEVMLKGIVKSYIKLTYDDKVRLENEYNKASNVLLSMYPYL